MSTFGDIRAAVTALRATPIPFAPSGSGLFSGMMGRAERTRELESMGSLGTIFSIVDAIASAEAGVTWNLFRTPGPNADPDAPPQRVTQHAALDLVARPNDFFSGQELFEATGQHLELTGEGWWVIAKDPRSPMPLEIWPVRPDRMAPVPSSERYLAGYVYSGPSGEQIPLDLDEVIFMRRPNPVDAYRGLGVVQSVLVDVDASRYTAEWNRNFFINSAEPGGIIKFDKALSDAEWKRIRDRWREQHQGVAQAHRVAILEQGSWVDRKFSMRDMQFRELREVNHEFVRRAWRWPASMLGDSGHVNRATAQADEYMVGKWILRPRMARFAGALNELLRMFYGGADPGLYFEPDMSAIVPEDEEAENAERDSKTKSFAALVSAGADPAWAAEVCELPPPPKMTPRPATAPVAPPAAAGRALVHSCPGCGLEDVVRV